MSPPPNVAARPYATPRLSALKVFMRGLRLDAQIGVYPHEHGRTQPLCVDVEVDLAAARVETLVDTLNYEILAEWARTLASSGHIDLVETYAQDLAAAVLRAPGALRVRVRIEKPEALAGVEAAGVELVLERGYG